MAAFFRSTIEQFLSASLSEVLAQLTLAYSREGFAEMKTDTPVTWWNDLAALQEAFATVRNRNEVVATWWILLEFSIPRRASRIDVVLLAGEEVILLECKSSKASSEAFRQVETYALLLHYFHRASRDRRITPFVINHQIVPATDIEEAVNDLLQGELEFEALPSYWISRPHVLSWFDLPDILMRFVEKDGHQIDGAQWDQGEYRPTPTIVEAALALRTGLRIGDIARHEAEDIDRVTKTIQAIFVEAQEQRRRVIVFLTGVPGSGKTLVGLSLAHLGETKEEAVHFMSGNGPLVRVLQSVFKRHAMDKGIRSTDASIQATTLIEDVHLFAKEYTESKPHTTPSNHVVIFDEAQRAWDFEHSKQKFGRAHSEPTMFLKIMERHEDWACVVALIGGGQEINSGEAGLEEWGKALAESEADWTIYASPEVLAGGPSTAGRRLFAPDISIRREVRTNTVLHLLISNRSLRAENLAHWVNLLLAGEAAEATELRITERFPIFLTRNLSVMRDKLRQEALGESRFGLVGSSKAARLRAEGLEPDGSFHRGYPWEHWYLAPRDDVRSSYACEVFATEFEIQGLELDWIGMCWGGDLIWKGDRWTPRKLWQGGIPKWSTMKQAVDQQYRLNAYRVLLTRARQGMVLYVPQGDVGDFTRNPDEMDATADFLVRCGIKVLN